MRTIRGTRKTLGAVTVALGCMLILCSSARAEVLDEQELRREMRQNAALREQVRHAGFPDLAQRLYGSSEWPWQPSMIRLFYLEPRKEVGLGRAYMDERPQFPVVRYRRPLSDELADEVARFLATMPPPAGDPVARAEVAARRAEAAATRAEMGAAAAERAVERLDSVTTQMERAFQKQLRK